MSAVRSIRIVAKGILALLIVVLIVVIVAFLALRKESVRTRLVNTLLTRIPLSGAAFSVTGADFDLRGNAELRGLHWTHGDSTIVRADTLRVRGDIVKIAGGALDFDEIVLSHALLDFESLRLFLKRESSPKQESAPDSQAGPGRNFNLRRVVLREVQLRHADVRLKAQASPDSGARWLAADFVHSFDGSVGIEGRDEGHHVVVQVDSIRALGRFGSTDTIPANILARGTYDSPKIHAEQLVIRTERTALDLHGDITIKNRRVDFRQAQLTLDAHPLSFEDVIQLVPQAPNEGNAELDLQLTDGIVGGSARFELADGDVNIPSLSFDVRELPHWKLEAALGPSQWNRRAIASAKVKATSSKGGIDVGANVQARGGDLRTRTRIRGSGKDRIFEIREAVFRGLDLSVWTEQPKLASNLNGSLSGNLRGLQPKTMRFDGTVVLDSSSMFDVHVDSANVDASLANGVLQSEIHLVQAANEVDFSGTIEPFVKPFRARGVAHGRGLFRETRIDTLFTAFEVADGTARIDTLSAASRIADASGAGIISWSRSLPDSSFVLHATLKDLTSLAPSAHLDTLGVSGGALNLALSGRVQEPLVHATLTADSLQASGMKLRELKALVDSDVSAKSAAFDISAVNDSSLAIRAAGNFAYVRDSAYPFRLDLATVELPVQQEIWKLEAPSSIAFARDRARMNELKLGSGAAHVAVDGETHRGGSQDLRVAVQSLDTKTIATLLKRPIPQGVLDANLEVQGEAADARAGGDLRWALHTEDGKEAGTLTVRGTLGRSSSDIEGRIEGSEGSALDFSGRLPYELSLVDPPAGEPWKPIRQTNAGMDLTMKADNFSLAALEPLVGSGTFQPIEGTVVVDLRMTGDPRAPDGQGRVSITKGRLGHVPWNVVYDDIQGELTLEGNRMSVRELSATSGKGRMTAQGDMALSHLKPGDFQLNLNLEDFSVMDSPNLHLDASGRMDLVRAGNSLSLTGDLVAEELEVFVNFATAGRGRERVELTDADREMLVRNFGPRVLEPRSTLFPDALRMAAIDVNVTAIQDSWIRSRRSPRLAAEVSGQIRAKKAPEQKFEYFGEINAIEGRSYVETFGRRFEIVEGELILEGDPSRSRFRAEATNEITPSNDPSETSVEITLLFEGSPRDYKFELSSDPALPNSEITTLLATGATSRNMRPTDAASKEAAGMALQAGLTEVTGALEESAQQTVGLDVVQIRQDGLRGVTLVAGEYVRPRVYLGLRQPVLFETEEVGQATDTGEDVQLEMEYIAHRRLSLDFLGEGDAFRLLARTRYAY